MQRSRDLDTSSPLVSIVVPVFNAERYLRESLDSITGQTHSNTEVIVVDDASTDASAEILADYGDAISWHRQPANRGIFGNINDGIRRANGEFVAIHHADDVYDPKIIENELRFFERHARAGAVFAFDTFINPGGEEFGRFELPRALRGRAPLEYHDFLDALLRYGNTFIRGGTSLIRSSVYEEVGLFRDDLSLRGDLDMWLRIACKHPIGILEEYLVQYRYGHENSSQQYDHLRTEPELSFAIVEKYLGRGDRRLVHRDALRAFEARRAEDRIMVAVNQYIRDSCDDARTTLGDVGLARIIVSKHVQRARLIVLLFALRLLVRLPRIGAVGQAFYRRWHQKSYRPRRRSLLVGAGGSR